MDSALKRVVAELKAARGIDLLGYHKETLQRRVAARIASVCKGDAEAYLRRLAGDPEEADRLIETITIHVSSFFRDPMVYDLLARDVLSEILERRRADGSKEIRVWSAGCAAGEEPYSIAILLDQALAEHARDWSCWIFATDLDQAALDRAKVGLYDRKQLGDTRLGVIDAYFTPAGDGFRLRPFVRDMIQLSWGDLVSPAHAIPANSVFGSFDLVLCRNVLIYYSPDRQATMFEHLHHSLAPGGYLVLGGAESLCRRLEGSLETVDRRCRIYRKPLRQLRV